MEDDRRRENMEKLRKDMQKSNGETVVLGTGLKDGKTDRKSMLVEDNEDESEEEDDEEDEDGRISEEEEDMLDDDDDDAQQEITHFSF